MRKLTVEELLEKDLSWFDTCSIEELEYYIEVLESASVSDHITQLTLKILINSLYGALANAHFILANPDMAAAVTSSGRFFIQLVANNVERELQALLPSDEPYVIYGDTDSSSPWTLIHTDSGKITIEDFFNSVEQSPIVTSSGVEIKRVANKQSLTFDMKRGIHYQPIDYVMRHKVKKQMYKITAGDKSVEVTGDHSLKVIRGGSLIDATATDLRGGDILVVLQDSETLRFVFSTDIKVEDLGIVEDYVYDIEVQNTHSFFANDILVHNSFYYSIKNIVKRKFGENASASTPGIVDWVDSFEKKVVQKIIQDSIEEYAEILNIQDPSQIGVEREVISDRAFFVAKKRYAARVLDMEGVRFNLDDPYIKTMGLEIARSSTPAWVKKKLQESISVILDNDQYGVRKWRDETKLQYQNQPLEDICAVQSVNSLDYKLGDKGIPQGSKAALAHNNWVQQQGLEDSIELLQPGEKYKRCYLLTPNRFGTEIISFGDPKIAKIIEEDRIFDYQTNFQKQFEQPLERMVESMNYDIRDVPVFGSLDDW